MMGDAKVRFVCETAVSILGWRERDGETLSDANGFWPKSLVRGMCFNVHFLMSNADLNDAEPTNDELDQYMKYIDSRRLIVCSRLPSPNQ